MDDDFHPSDLLDDTVLGSAGGSRMAALKVRKYLIFYSAHTTPHTTLHLNKNR